MTKFNVSGLVENSSVDGAGLRLALFFQGCKHACVGCHNPETWSFDEKKLYSQEELLEEIENNCFNKKITLTGGDPLFQDNIIELTKELKKRNYNIWLYTGFTKEQIEKNEKLKDILKYIDVLVDGKFEEDKKDFRLQFKGSSNQNIYHLNKESSD